MWNNILIVCSSVVNSLINQGVAGRGAVGVSPSAPLRTAAARECRARQLPHWVGGAEVC